MANKHIKNCSTLVFREIQVEVITDHYPHIKMVEIKRPDILSANKDAENIAGRKVKWYNLFVKYSLWKMFWQLLHYHVLIIQPSSTLPKNYFPKRNENMFTQRPCMHVYSGLAYSHPNWKQLECSSAGSG